MSRSSGGEVDGMTIVEILELHVVEVPIQASEASQPWCAQDDVDVISYVEEEGVDVEDFCVDAYQNIEGCCSARSLIIAAHEYDRVDVLFSETKEVSDINIDDVVCCSRVDQDVDVRA